MKKPGGQKKLIKSTQITIIGLQRSYEKRFAKKRIKEKDVEFFGV